MPVAGLFSVILSLKDSGLTLGIATSDSASGAQATLCPFNVLDQFDFIAGYDSGFGVKPEPGMVFAFCRATGSPASAVMVVGDSRHDLEMGRQAGAGLGIGVLTGSSRRTDLADLADHVVDSIADISGLLGLETDGGVDGLA